MKVPEYKHEVRVPSPIASDRSQVLAYTKNMQACREWCEANAKGLWDVILDANKDGHLAHCIFCFVDENDAIHFKLRWVG